MAETKKRVLAGRYRIETAIGQGGMARVFRATDEVLGRTVAVKVLAPQYARDGQFVERFRREAQAAAALNHANVVSVFDTGSEGPVHYIVMEHVEGRTLRDVIAQDGRLHPSRAAEITEALSRALAAAHEQGLVHRDVKPGNVMITAQGDVKVMDFGIARATSGEALTQTATVLGTAAYFSPEQAKGEAVDARSDIYSAGCVLYEMLTGRAPFTGDSPVAIAYQHVREDPTPPSRLNPDVPPPLEAITLKALAKNPANRYQSATEMAEDLGRATRGLPVHATPVLPGDATQVVTRVQRDRTAAMPALEDAEDFRGGGRRTGMIVGVSLGVLALLGIAAWLLISQLTAKAPTIAVPRVIGLQQKDAEALLQQQGFRVTAVQQQGPEKKGKVVDQTPKQDQQAEKGSLVTIYVSTGPEDIVVPGLSGKTLEDAGAELIAAGLKLGEVSRKENPDVEEGIVFEQSPISGEKAKPGSAVSVTVSKGRTTVFVPGTPCADPDEAKELMKGQDLKFKRAGSEFSASCPAGTVARTEPVAGEEVDRGSTVQWYESEGPEPEPSPTPIVSISP